MPAGPVNSPTWRKRAERERERQRGGESLQVWQKQGVGGGFRLSGREEAEEMSRQGYISKTEGWDSRKERSEWERKRKAVSGWPRKERRQTRERNADSQQRRRRWRRRGEGGGREGLAWHTERAGAERGRFWIRETDKRDRAGEVTQARQEGEKARQLKRRRDGEEQNDSTLSCCTEYDDGTVLPFRFVGEYLSLRPLALHLTCNRGPTVYGVAWRAWQHCHWAWNINYLLTDEDSIWPRYSNGGAAEVSLIGHSLWRIHTANVPPQAKRTARCETTLSQLWSDVARCTSGYALFARCCCGICSHARKWKAHTILNIKSSHSQKLHAAVYNVCLGEPVWTYGAVGKPVRLAVAVEQEPFEANDCRNRWSWGGEILRLYCCCSCLGTQVCEWNGQVSPEQLSVVFFFLDPTLALISRPPPPQVSPAVVIIWTLPQCDPFFHKCT